MILGRKKVWLAFFVILLFIVASSLILSQNSGRKIDKAGPSFIFTAVGDYGANKFTEKNLKNIAKQRPDLHFVLGDFSYSQVSPESEWCKFVKKYLSNVPIMLLAGNHESDGKDGLLENFISCLPNTLTNVEGDYGKEYFFDYPEDDPLVRFIMISPDLRFSNGETFAYVSGSDHFVWLKKVMTDRRNKNIPWTIVGMHKTCLAAGDKACEIGDELTNYLLKNKVDLILQGHAHSYQRTRQLICVKTDVFDSSCVGDNDVGEYQQGNGGIISIVGTGGASPRAIDYNDPETPYFAFLQGNTYGFMKFEVQSSNIKGTFYSASEEEDVFTIQR